MLQHRNRGMYTHPHRTQHKEKPYDRARKEQLTLSLSRVNDMEFAVRQRERDNGAEVGERQTVARETLAHYDGRHEDQSLKLTALSRFLATRVQQRHTIRLHQRLAPGTWGKKVDVTHSWFKVLKCKLSSLNPFSYNNIIV